MMVNNIQFSTRSRKLIKMDTENLGVSGENEIEKLSFSLSSYIDGEARLEINKYGQHGFIQLNKEDDNYTLEVKNSLLDVAVTIEMQLVIFAGGQVWKSETFEMYVEKAINATETIPEQYPSWIDNLNSLVEQVNSTLDTTVAQITDLTDTYNANAEKKTTDFNNNHAEKKQVIDETCSDMQEIKTSVEQTKTEVETLKSEVDTKAQQIELKRQEVANNTEIVEQDKTQVAQDKTSVNSTMSDFLNMMGNDVATLENGKVPINQIPRIAITETKTFASIEERDDWESQEGDIAIVTSNNKSYIKDGNGDWNWLESPSDYSANSGHSATSDFASNSEKINGKRIISMIQDAYDNAFDNGTLLEDTFYFVHKEE